jgi:hypothetical protein
MKVEIRIERDKETLKRYNFNEDALEIYNDFRHMAIPLSKVTGEALRKVIDELYLPLILGD